jgi:RNA polymerase sigma factor (sigma-70 family)
MMGEQEKSFPDLLQHYNGMIFHLIKKLNIEDPEQEFYHQAVIALWKAKRSFNPQKGSFSTYAYAYMKGALLNELSRRSHFYDRHSLREEWFCNDETSGFIHETERHIWIEQISKSLTRNQSIWLKKYCLEGKDSTQIAKELGVSVSLVKSWRRGAISKLKKCLRKEFLQK